MDPEHNTRAGPPVIACVTALNEEATVGGVVAALKAAPSISRVQLVDDGSTDDTAGRARAAGATVRTLPEWVPVGEAIMNHLDMTGEEEAILLWCDADLTGLTPDHVEALIARYRRGDVTQSLSSRATPPNWPGWLRTSARPFWAWFFGPISGERVILQSDFAKAIALARRLEWAEMMRGYGIVLFLNWYADQFGRGTAITYLDGLRQRQKFQKWQGSRPRLQMVKQWIVFGSVWLKIRMNAGRIKRMGSEQPPR